MGVGGETPGIAEIIGGMVPGVVTVMGCRMIVLPVGQFTIPRLIFRLYGGKISFELMF